MKLLFLDRSTQLHTVTDLDTRPRGGMVSSLFKVSDYLSHRGHDVTVFSDIKTPGETASGVKWVNDDSVSGPCFDVLITNRGTGSGYDQISARRRALWTHDLPHAGFIPNPKTAKAFDCVVFMSKYAERIWRDFYRDIGKSVLIPNGVDRSVFYPREKDLDYLIFASAPNRGLERLPFIFDAIEARIKRPIRMEAFSNLSKLHPNEVGESDSFSSVYNRVSESRVEMKDPVPQQQLGHELGIASLMILPTDYPEICSNIILQSLACGTPVITTGRLGSACEWVRHGVNGMLTKWHPVDYMAYQVDMIRNAVKVLENEKLHRKMIWKASTTRLHDWDEIGEKWHKMLTRFY